MAPWAVKQFKEDLPGAILDPDVVSVSALPEVDARVVGPDVHGLAEVSHAFIVWSP